MTSENDNIIRFDPRSDSKKRPNYSSKELQAFATKRNWELNRYEDIDFQALEDLDIPPDVMDAYLFDLIYCEGADEKDIEQSLDLLYPVMYWLNWYSDFPEGIQVPKWGWSYFIHGFVPRKFMEPEFEEDSHLRKMLEEMNRFFRFLDSVERFDKYKAFASAYKHMVSGVGKLKRIKSPPPKPHDVAVTSFQPDGITLNGFHFDLVLYVVAFVDFDEDLSAVLDFLRKKSRGRGVASRAEKLEWAENLYSYFEKNKLTRSVVQTHDMDSKEVGRCVAMFYDMEFRPIVMKTLWEHRENRRD